MLAAGNGEDFLRVPGDRIVKGIIRGSIAGMKGDDHVHILCRGILGDIADLEPEGGIAVLPRRLVAFLNDVRFQVQADDFHVQVTNFGEIVVKDEGQVGLSATEIDDAEGLVRNIVFILIINDFQEAVDLFKLVIPGTDDLSFRGHDAHIHQRRNNHALLQDMVLLPVGESFGAHQGGRLDGGGGADVGFSLFGQEDFHDPAVAEPEVQLAVGICRCFEAEGENISGGDGFMEHLGDRKGRNKELISVSFRPDLPVFCF